MDVDTPEVQAAAESYRARHTGHSTRTDRPDVTATDFDSRYPCSRIVTGHEVGRPATQGLSQHHRCSAVKDPERLLRALIHRHLATNKIGTDGGNPDAENTLDAHLDTLVHLDQTYRSLADVLIQKTTLVQMKTAQAYHSSE
jgi:hypothetical protein